MSRLPGIGFWMLDAFGNPIAVDDCIVWAEWFNNADRCVARTQVGKFYISTTFIGTCVVIDGQPPPLWETTVFCGFVEHDLAPGHKFPREIEVHRWRSRAEAEAGHAAIVARLVSKAIRSTSN